jgi:CRISPR/Cas system-associated exonuclease Cas4 (RecB family)
MSLEITEKLVNEIVERRKQYLLSKIKRYPVNNFRASDIPDCDRYMVHSILNWDERTLYDEWLQATFDRGNAEEKQVIIDLMTLGFEFIHQQMPFEIKNRASEVICRGHIDGKILWEGKAIPCEIKSMNINTFNSLNSIEDFTKKPLHRKYLRQMQLYLFGNNEEAGVFILTDLQGHYKFIVVILSYEECEWILKRLEKNWEFVKNREYPDRIEYSDKICGRCAFSHLCLPEVKHEGSQMIENEILEGKLERREELKKLADEYETLDDEIKEPFKKNRIPQAFVGTSWQITTKVSTGTRVDTKSMPDDIKKQYEVPTEKVVVQIINLDKNKKRGDESGQ